MAKTLDLGRRIELHSMDTHCGNISVGLYSRDVGGVSHFLVHTYSEIDGVSKRLAYLCQALRVMIGLEESSEAPGWLRFSCGTIHERALKRAFLDLCKLDTGAPLAAKPLTVFDKKADCDLAAASLGGGVYRMGSLDDAEKGAKRAAALTRGFLKVCEMQEVEGEKNQVVFPCATSHDEMIGMLMFRAQNVRAAMSEEESSAAKGVLSAPSQQK